MPWKLRVNQADVADAIDGARSWREVMVILGYAYHGKNIASVRKWAERWGISTDHLSDARGQRRGSINYSEDALREVIASSFSWAESLRKLGYCPTGGNHATLKKRVAQLGLSTAHFDPYRASRKRAAAQMTPLDEVLVENSSYSRSSLKRRLFEAGLKKRRCELCGQDETWNGRRITLIIDHINGVRNDHRLENLRIVCPNCAAGLDTHCGRKNRIEVEPRECARCGAEYFPNRPQQRYCSVSCGQRHKRKTAVPRPRARRVERPPHVDLVREVRERGYLATGRKYGVSDNAIRKWIRQYERERAVAEGRDPDVAEIPTRTWPGHKAA
jgi:hypothetical protein